MGTDQLNRNILQSFHLEGRDTYDSWYVRIEIWWSMYRNRCDSHSRSYITVVSLAKDPRQTYDRLVDSGGWISFWTLEVLKMFSGTQFFVGCFGDVDFYNSNFFQITVMVGVSTEVFRALVTESRLARWVRATPWLRSNIPLIFLLKKVMETLPQTNHCWFQKWRNLKISCLFLPTKGLDF